MLSFFGCCVIRQKPDHHNMIDNEEEKFKETRENTFLNDFEELEKLIRISEGTLRRCVIKIRLASYKSSIQERPLKEILENVSTNDEYKSVPQSIKNIQKIFKTKYFQLSDETGYEILQLLDSLKIICFLVLESKESEDIKVNTFIETILEESKGNDYFAKDVSDNEIYYSDNAGGIQFHK